MSKSSSSVLLPSEKVGGSVRGASVKCPEKLLDLQRVTPYFAPSAPGEKLTIEYNIKNMERDEVSLEIIGRDGITYYRRLLTTSEKKAPLWGLKSIEWTGQMDNQRYITPFASPYEVRLYDVGETHGGFLPFQILCETLELVMAPWDPKQDWAPNTAAPGAGPLYQKWLRFKLNNLGYFAGPVAGGLGTYEANATTRYRASHKALVKRLYADYLNLSLGDEALLKEALKKNENPRPFFTKAGGQALKAGDKLDQGAGALKVHVESLWWMAMAPGDEFIDQYPDPVHAAGATSRNQREVARLNRPLIPMEAVILLKGSDGRPKLAPEGTGPIKVVWSYEEPHEDLSRQIPDDAAVCSYPRRYVEKCLKLGGGRTATTGNNCLPASGGIRGTPPFLAGAHYPPFTAVITAQTAETTAYTGASVGGETYPKRLARAGLYFQPSYIAGDAYKLKVEIDRVGLDPGQRALSDQSSPIEVWRSAKVAATVGWPARDLSGEWAAVKREYAAAYVDLDVSSVAQIAITSLLSDVEYEAWFDEAFGPNMGPHVKPLFNMRISPNAMTSIRSDREDPGFYLVRVLGEESIDALWARLYPKVRAKHPSGIVFITHQVVDPSQVPDAPAASMSLANGGILIDRSTPGKAYHILSHEMGHGFWLHHGRHTLKTQGAFPQSLMRNEHDPSDHNCIMDYTDEGDAAHPHRRAATYSPHFCGKCNLKLRGWNVLDPGLPMDDPRVVAAAWEVAQ